MLLHLCVCLQAVHSVYVTALHIDHGLHPHSGQWCKHCQWVAADLGVHFRSARLSPLAAQGSGLEAVARTARYRALAKLNDGCYIVVGHHQQDQAETVLLRLIRGSGVAGLAAMQAVSRMENNLILRPFLSLPRQQLQVYADDQGLEWLEDPSNTDIRYDRNCVRHRIIPLMRQMRPGVDRVLARVASHMTQTGRLLDEIAQADLSSASADAHSHYAVAAVLDCQLLRSLSIPRRANLLRYWVRNALGQAPTTRQQQTIDRLVSAGQQSGLLQLGWYSCRRYREHLHLLAQLPDVPAPLSPVHFPGNRQAESSEIVLSGELTTEGGLRICEAGYEIRFRCGGESIHWCGHRRYLKGLFQRFAIPPWERGLMPLLYVEDELVAVADLWVADSWQVDSPELAVSLHWARATMKAPKG